MNLLKKKYDGQYIRVVNYHDIPKQDKKTFEQQLRWYAENYTNTTYRKMDEFLQGREVYFAKPGIIITFDDGLCGNFDNALPLLEQYGFTGYFMCSSDLCGMNGYMNYDGLREIVERGHVIGVHTATHHRMEESDTEEILHHEVTESKTKLEHELNRDIDIFCWCGGEEKHYTQKAYKTIVKSKYKYAFMTNSEPVARGTNPLHIQRSNIEGSWPLYLVEFQLCGIMDWRFANKRKRVLKKITKE